MPAIKILVTLILGKALICNYCLLIFTAVIKFLDDADLLKLEILANYKCRI